MAAGGIQSVPRLSRERVLSAALLIADKEGLPALTMRRLASELDVGPMSLYRYIQTKRDLLDGVVELALVTTLQQPSPAGPWDAKVSAHVRLLYEALLAHPAATQILADGVIPGALLDGTRNDLIGLLIEAGFDTEQAVIYLHTLVTYTLGFALAAGNDARPEPAEWERLSTVPRDQFSHLSEAARHYPKRFEAEAFEAGLSVIIAGLHAKLTD